MKIKKPVFFTDYSRRESVPSSAPIEADFEHARKLLNLLRSEGSFLGIMLDADRVLQFFRESSGTFSMELLNRRDRFIEEAEVTVATAESALRGAFEGVDIKGEMEHEFVKWTKSTLDNS